MAASTKFPKCPYPAQWKKLDKDDLASLEDYFPELINWLVSCQLNVQDGEGGNGVPQGTLQGSPMKVEAVWL